MEFFGEKKAMACLDEGGGLWYNTHEKSITDKRSAQETTLQGYPRSRHLPEWRFFKFKREDGLWSVFAITIPHPHRTDEKSTAKGLERPRLWIFLWGDEGAVEKILLSRYATSILFLGKGGGMLVGKGGKGMAFQKADDAKCYVFDSSLNASSSAITLSRRGKYFSSIRWMASSRLESSGLSLPNRT